MIQIKALATGSSGNCYRVTDGQTAILLECGISYKKIQQKLDYQVMDIQGCLITHEHNDHKAGIKDVLKNGINCYMSAGTREGIGIDHHRIKTVKNKEVFHIGTWSIISFDVMHDVNEPFGFLLVNQQGEKLLFVTDTYYVPHRFTGLTHIMVECNYCQSVIEENTRTGRIHPTMKKRVMKSHFSLENVLEFLKANDLSKVQEIWLLHLSDNNSDEALIRTEVAKLTGKMIYIP